MPLNLVLILLGLVTAGPTPSGWTLQKSGTNARLRGVHALDARTVWASGTKGTFLTTTDGGSSWTTGTVPGAEALDFRDVHAFNAQTAVLLASGAGPLSQIFQSDDGGKTWKRRFTNIYPGGFLDALAFWDHARGLALGDPVDGAFQIFLTEDGGKTWHRATEGMPVALPGEGAFAASGTCLVTQGGDHAWFATGGARVSRVFRTVDGGKHWEAFESPVPAGNPSSGIFSLAFRDASHGLAVGGDYKRPDSPVVSIARTSDGGRTWTRIEHAPGGYFSAVSFLPGATPSIIVAGPNGSHYSADDGKSWTSLGREGFHAIGVAGPAGAAWAVGDDGKVSRLSER